MVSGFKKIFGKDFIRVKLSLLWLFVLLNYVYADIMSLMDLRVLNDILAGAFVVPEVVLLLGAVLMEIPIVMIFLSLILEWGVNRWFNIVAGLIKTLAVLGSLMVGAPVLYYLFFAVVEIVATLSIVIIAWRWKR